MAHNPVVDITNHLDANSTAVTLGTNLFMGPVRAHSSTGGGVPVEAVFVNGYGGRPADRFFGSTASEVRYPSIQAMVRSGSFASGYALAWTVYNTMQSASPSTTNTYMDVAALQSEPNFVELDKNHHYHWSINWRVTYTA